MKFNQSSLLIICLAMFSLFLSSCDDDDDVALQTTSYQYTVHNGQAVPSAPYGGAHPTDFTSEMKLEELENGNTKITVTLNNTIDGEVYHMHAHDAADASTTTNGTPYNEAPNADIFVQMITGNGNSVTVTQEATMSYSELTTDYSGFFVIHDPLQDVSTIDISTYVVVGGFARTQDNPDYASSTFEYQFNTGQLVPDFAYTGEHNNSLSASIQVDELAENRSRITVRLMNTMNGMVYNTHAHDMADASTTPNGTPYIESPNAGVFASQITGNGSSEAIASTNVSEMSFSDITTTYDGFLVVHDPLQAVTTVDPTTYVILGVFGR